MPKVALILLVGCTFVPGCGRTPTTAPRQSAPDIAPLPVQQASAYPEARTGRFTSLIDFEDRPTGQRGFEQVRRFSFVPAPPGGQCRFAVNITRTGTGAMAVSMSPRATLRCDVPADARLGEYALLSLAVYVERPRDDLRVSLMTGRAAWRSPRKVVQPGWNTVEVDLHGLRSRAGFSPDDVRAIALTFEESDRAVEFYLDDILAIDNARRIEPTPAGVTLGRIGLTYELSLPVRNRPFRLGQGPDGLWRLGDDQPTLQLAPPGQYLPATGEMLDVLGDRRAGSIEILEVNRVRVRLANTWLFPRRMEDWTAGGMRKARWEYTFYGDGRWVTHLELNNSGGEEIGRVRFWLNAPAVWSGGAVSRDLVLRDFPGPVAMWSYLLAPPAAGRNLYQENYLTPGRVEWIHGDRPGPATRDAGRAGFDRTQGCFFVRADGGPCRFAVVPPPGGLLNPVFRVAGAWNGGVNVNCEGLPIRDVAICPDGWALFVIPGRVERPVAIEVTGSRASPANP